jgi:hypothetical protein
MAELCGGTQFPRPYESPSKVPYILMRLPDLILREDMRSFDVVMFYQS